MHGMGLPVAVCAALLGLNGTLRKWIMYVSSEMASICDPVSAKDGISACSGLPRALKDIGIGSSSSFSNIDPTFFFGDSHTSWKWFIFPHFRQSFPQAGQSFLKCLEFPPQNRQDPSSFFSFDGLLLLSNDTVFLAWYADRRIALIVWSSWRLAAWSWDVSAVRSIVTALSRVSVSPCSNILMRTSLSATPDTIWPRILVASHLAQQSLLYSLFLLSSRSSHSQLSAF